MPAKKIFLSYARSDQEFALKLARDLIDAGADLFVDQFDIDVSDNWDASIEAALDACEDFVVLLSQASVASENVRDEINFALEESKRIVPVVSETCKIPFRLRRKQHADLTNGYKAGFKVLTKALRLRSTGDEWAAPYDATDRPSASAHIVSALTTVALTSLQDPIGFCNHLLAWLEGNQSFAHVADGILELSEADASALSRATLIPERILYEIRNSKDVPNKRSPDAIREDILASVAQTLLARAQREELHSSHSRIAPAASDLTRAELAVLDHLRGKADIDWTPKVVENTLKSNRPELRDIFEEIPSAISSLLKGGYLEQSDAGLLKVAERAILYYRQQDMRRGLENIRKPPFSAEADSSQSQSRQAGDLWIAPESGIRFCYCPPGEFLMGSPDTEVGRFDNESRHRVTLSRGFWISETPVTQKQWFALMHSRLSHFNGEAHPVESLDWLEAIDLPDTR